MSENWVVHRGANPQKISQVLSEYGFAIVPQALSALQHRGLCSQLEPHFDEAPFSNGPFYGRRTKRFGRVLSKSADAQALALHPLAYGTSRAVLGADCVDIQLNLTQAIEIWPGSFAQAPHRDQEIWHGCNHVGEMMVNAMWAIDDFTASNGATLVWPGSHLTPDVREPTTAGVAVEMPKGSLCLFLGSIIHAGGPNWSDRARRGLVLSYCLGWLKPTENPWLSYPPDVARSFSPEVASLIGYRMDPPSLNNVDGRSPAELLRPVADTGFDAHLTDDQVDRIERFNESQLQQQPKAA